MPKYTVGKNWFFPELGRKPELEEELTIPGDLTEEQAKKYFAEPGLLKPVRQKAQAHPEVIRQTREAKEDETPPRRPSRKSRR